MKKIIATLALIAVLASPSASFAGSLGQFATPVNAGSAGSAPAMASAIRNAVTVHANAVNANDILTFGLSNFKIANPGFKIFKNVGVSVEKMQDLGTFAGADFSFKF